MKATRALREAALYLFACVLPLHLSAAELPVPRDGWASWQVPALDNAPDWCCFGHWNGAKAARQPCALDSAHGTYGGQDEATTDSIRVYAKFADGKIERLRALSATCPVRAAAPIQDLGSVSVDDSARWLMRVVDARELETKRHDRISDDALAALAIHRGTVAHNALVELARGETASSRTSSEDRNQAVFWLAHLRGVEGADAATSIMFGDPSADIREHAAFAVSQSKSPHADRDLIRLANTDSDASVRGHAWFSLAMTRSSRTEDAIDAALRKEKDPKVREQAVFALSQLPDDRGTHALIKVAEDRSLAREERKRAIFWLSQSESNAAQTYLEQVLARAPY